MPSRRRKTAREAGGSWCDTRRIRGTVRRREARRARTRRRGRGSGGRGRRRGRGGRPRPRPAAGAPRSRGAGRAPRVAAPRRCRSGARRRGGPCRGRRPCIRGLPAATQGHLRSPPSSRSVRCLRPVHLTRSEDHGGLGRPALEPDAAREEGNRRRRFRVVGPCADAERRTEHGHRGVEGADDERGLVLDYVEERLPSSWTVRLPRRPSKRRARRSFVPLLSMTLDPSGRRTSRT